MSQVVECGRGSCMRSIGRCVDKFGWQDVSGDVVRELSEADVKGMLVSVAWRIVRDEWMKKMLEKPKLSMINEAHSGVCMSTNFINTMM